jgi:hypothetical protein
MQKKGSLLQVTRSTTAEQTRARLPPMGRAGGAGDEGGDDWAGSGGAGPAAAAAAVEGSGGSEPFADAPKFLVFAHHM